MDRSHDDVGDVEVYVVFMDESVEGALACSRLDRGLEGRALVVQSQSEM